MWCAMFDVSVQHSLNTFDPKWISLGHTLTPEKWGIWGHFSFSDSWVYFKSLFMSFWEGWHTQAAVKLEMHRTFSDNICIWVKCFKCWIFWVAYFMVWQTHMNADMTQREGLSVIRTKLSVGRHSHSSHSVYEIISCAGWKCYQMPWMCFRV